MKKIALILSMILFGTSLYSQQGVSNELRDESANTTDGIGTEFFCETAADYGQDPVNYFAITSDLYFPYKVYDDFYGVTGNIYEVDFWGITAFFDGFFNSCTENPKSFEIAFYENDGGSIGTMVASYNVTVMGYGTGNFLDVHEIYKYSTPIYPPVTGLSDGWMSVQGNPISSCQFLWSASASGNGTSYQEGSGWREDDLAFCIYAATPEDIPLSNWALGLGIFLIVVATVIRMRRF